MQKTRKTGGDYNASRHQQPTAPQQQKADQHHNSVIGLYTHKQQAASANNAPPQAQRNIVETDIQAMRRLGQ